MKLTTYLLLISRTRMRGAMPPLFKFVFMAWGLIKARGQLYFYAFFTALLQMGMEV
jgi:hypothetical protein